MFRNYFQCLALFRKIDNENLYFLEEEEYLRCRYFAGHHTLTWGARYHDSVWPAAYASWRMLIALYPDAIKVIKQGDGYSMVYHKDDAVLSIVLRWKRWARRNQAARRIQRYVVPWLYSPHRPGPMYLKLLNDPLLVK